jgi:dTDP-4-amino-4,6-dideoxygalactose transaminase
MTSAYRFPAIRPEVPAMAQWSHHLARAEASNWFTNFGELSLELERALLVRWGFSGSAVVCTNNGTSGIAAPLIAEDVSGPVLLPAFTFPATFSAVKMAGRQPVLMDVSLEEWLVDANELDRRLGETKARAAVLVSPFGLNCDFSRHIEVARAHKAVLIIDSAAGLGLERSNIESAGHVYEAYSMHATKPFGIGEGGAIFCARAAASKLRSALNFGLPTRFGADVSSWGINGKISEAHAAVGLAVLDSFETRLARRRELAARYIARLNDVAGIEFPADPQRSTWQVFPVLMPTASAANALVDAARQKGMEVRRYYRPSLTHWFNDTPCPNSDVLAERMICFPIYSCDDEIAGEMADIVEASVTRALQKAEA